MSAIVFAAFAVPPHPPASVSTRYGSSTSIAFAPVVYEVCVHWRCSGLVTSPKTSTVSTRPACVRSVSYVTSRLVSRQVPSASLARSRTWAVLTKRAVTFGTPETDGVWVTVGSERHGVLSSPLRTLASGATDSKVRVSRTKPAYSSSSVIVPPQVSVTWPPMPRRKVATDLLLGPSAIVPLPVVVVTVA